jgi:hypothetical protein
MLRPQINSGMLRPQTALPLPSRLPSLSSPSPKPFGGKFHRRLMQALDNSETLKRRDNLARPSRSLSPMRCTHSPLPPTPVGMVASSSEHNSPIHACCAVPGARSPIHARLMLTDKHSRSWHAGTPAQTEAPAGMVASSSEHNSPIHACGAVPGARSPIHARLMLTDKHSRSWHAGTTAHNTTAGLESWSLEPLSLSQMCHDRSRKSFFLSPHLFMWLLLRDPLWTLTRRSAQ